MATIKNADASSVTIFDGATSWARSQGTSVELVKEVTIEAKMTTPSAADKKKLDELLALKPDVVVVAGSSGDVEATIKILRSHRLENGYSPKAIVAANAWSSMSTWQSMKDFTDLRGVIMPDQWAESPLDRDHFTGYTSSVFKDKMKAKGIHASWPAASAFSAMSVIAHAMKLAPQGQGAVRPTKAGAAAGFVGQLDLMKGSTAKATPTIFGSVSFAASGAAVKPIYGRQYYNSEKSMVVPPSFMLDYPMESDAPCKCKYQGLTLAAGNYTDYPVSYPPGCEASFTCQVGPGQYKNMAAVGVYGSMCAAWDQMPQTPLSATCAGKTTEDYGKPEYNWCQQPWCYVDKTCPDAKPTNVFHGNTELFYSYQTCGHYADCYTWTTATATKAVVAVETRRRARRLAAAAPAPATAAPLHPNMPAGCPYDPYGIPSTPLTAQEKPEDALVSKHYFPKQYKVYKGGGCECLYAGKQLAPAMFATVGTFTYNSFVGTTCAAWDQMPGTPSYASCPVGSDWCFEEVNYCQAPWCFVGKDCGTKIASSMYGAGNFFSYDTCLGAPDCRPKVAGSPRRLAAAAAAMPAAVAATCPFDYSAISWVTAKECPSGGYAVNLKTCMEIAAGATTKFKGALTRGTYAAKVFTKDAVNTAVATLAKGVVAANGGQYCPIVEVPKVKVSLTMSGINFDDLAANPTFMASFKDTCCVSFTTAMGVPKEMCETTVAAGSVKVSGAIGIPAGSTSASMQAAVGATDLAGALTSSVSSMPGISAMTYGNIGVSGLAISVVMVATTVVSAPPVICRSPDAGLTTANTDAASRQTFLLCLITNCEDYVVGHHRAARRLAATAVPAPAPAPTQVNLNTKFCSAHSCADTVDTSALAPASGTDAYTAKYGLVGGIKASALCPSKCGMCATGVNGVAGGTPTPTTRGDNTPMPTPYPTIPDGGMAVVINLALKITGVTFNELKDNPSIRSEFLSAVKAGILQASNLNKTNEISLLMAAGSVIVEATITPPVGEEHTYMHLCKKGIKKVANQVAMSLQAVPNIDSVGTGVITVQITKAPIIESLPASSFNAAFGQVAGERDYDEMGAGQCRLKNEQMKIPLNFVFTDASNDCRRLCNERVGCFGFTSNAVFVTTLDAATNVPGHSASDGTGPCTLWLQSGLAADGFDEYDGNCFVKRAYCSIDLICPAGQCGQCKATGENTQTDSEDVERRMCKAEVCDPDIDSAVCCEADFEDEDADGALPTSAPGFFVLVVSIVGSLFVHLN